MINNQYVKSRIDLPKEIMLCQWLNEISMDWYYSQIFFNNELSTYICEAMFTQSKWNEE